MKSFGICICRCYASKYIRAARVPVIGPLLKTTAYVSFNSIPSFSSSPDARCSATCTTYPHRHSVCPLRRRFRASSDDGKCGGCLSCEQSTNRLLYTCESPPVLWAYSTRPERANACSKALSSVHHHPRLGSATVPFPGVTTSPRWLVMAMSTSTRCRPFSSRLPVTRPEHVSVSPL